MERVNAGQIKKRKDWIDDVFKIELFKQPLDQPLK